MPETPSAFPRSDELRWVQFTHFCAFIVADADTTIQLCLCLLCVSHAEKTYSHRGPHAHGHLEWPGLLQINAGRGRQRAAERQPALLQALPEHHQQPAATGATIFWFHGHKIKWKIRQKQNWNWLNFETVPSGPPGYFTNGAAVVIQLQQTWSDKWLSTIAINTAPPFKILWHNFKFDNQTSSFISICTIPLGCYTQLLTVKYPSVNIVFR